MQIAIVGPGGIGSTFALQLANAGHEVTLVARGQRLAELERDRSIVASDGRRARVAVAPSLDTTRAWDLVLVTVLASQVGSLLPVLTASRAKTVMFMFNTFEPLEPLRAAVGEGRFAFGFPAIVARIDDGKLVSKIVGAGMRTTVSDPAVARLFGEAGVPSVVHADMQSWLRTHAAFIVPILAIASVAHLRKRGITWGEAMRSARAMSEGFQIVRAVGSHITPAAMVAVSILPDALTATALWALSRAAAFRAVGAAGPREPRVLIDMMSSVAGFTPSALLALRP